MTTDNTTTTKPAAKSYDLTPIRTKIAEARAAINGVVTACVKDKNFGKASPLRDMATLDSWLVDAEAKLDAVGKPRVKKERKAKK